MVQQQTGELKHRELKSRIGSEVLSGKDELLSGRHADEIRALLEQRGVLVFPRVGFSEGELIAFTRTLGEYAPDMADGGVTPISLDGTMGANAEYTKSSFYWHFDGYMQDVPIVASV